MTSQGSDVTSIHDFVVGKYSKYGPPTLNAQ